jgi:hypothetical protein
VNLLRVLTTCPASYEVITRDVSAFTDALSYVCTRAANLDKLKRPLQVYFCPDAIVNPVHTRERLLEALHQCLPEPGSTISVIGMVESLSSPFTWTFGFQQHCPACGCVSVCSLSSVLLAFVACAGG